jgi:hypothetical protein
MGDEMAERLYITVCGNIGAGKTSLVNLLCEEFGWRSYYEEVQNHPYLDDYYRDMNRWGFHTQIYFLTQRLKQQQQIAQIPVTVCQDRSIYEDHEIFAKSLLHLGIMSQRDYLSYRQLFEAIAPYITRPDLLIYLSASVPTLAARIALRSRGCESGISPNYLEHLNERYADWMGHFDLCPILTLDADRLDFVQRNGDLRFIFDEVQRCLDSEPERQTRQPLLL